MEVIELKIGSVGAAPLFPEDRPLLDGEALLRNVSILQAGMMSGNTSLVFTVQLPSGRCWCVQMSATMLNVIASAVKGAEERWAAENN